MAIEIELDNTKENQIRKQIVHLFNILTDYLITL